MKEPTTESEARLDALRREAKAKGSVSGAGVRPEGAPFPVASPQTGYYRTPLLKPHQWTWEVPLYFFVGGASGAAAIIGGVAKLTGAERELWRDARWIAAAGSASSSALLVSDLGKPERFLNMLRVFKKRSAMSVGAWTLVAFSSAASAAAFGEWLERKGHGSLAVRIVGDLGALGSVVSGAAMATYTGVLIGATAVPVWSQSVGKLPLIFGASALGSGAALLEIAGHRQRSLGFLAGCAAVAETLFEIGTELSDDRALHPLKEGRSGALVRGGSLLSGPLHLLLRLTGQRRAASVSMILGSLLLRYGWIAAGRASALSPDIPLQLDTPKQEKRSYE